MQSKDEGSIRAPIAVVLEAYGRYEEIYDRPLVGPSWNDKLVPWLRDVKLDRSDLYITNTWDQGQPSSIYTIPESEMRASMDRLHDRLALLEGPDGNGPMLIVACGNYALYALTGNGRVSFHSRDGRHERPGIKDWRGSVLQYQDKRGRKIKVIPTCHPASTFYKDVGLSWVLAADWKRIAEDAKFRELRLPERTHMIAPSEAEFREYVRWTRGEATKPHFAGSITPIPRLVCSLDVETPFKTEYETRQKESKSEAATAKCRSCKHAKRWHSANTLGNGFTCAGLRGKGGCSCAGFAPLLSKPRKVKISEDPYLGCIGYSWDPELSMTVPTTLEYWQDPEVWARVKKEIAAFHADPNIAWGGQNFGFDAWWCAVEEIPLSNMAWDLMKMHRVRVPYSEWHSLSFQASLYTRQNFWKHEAKLPDEISRWSHNKEALWRYNGIDNCVQRELFDKHTAALHENGRYEYYQHMEAPIDPALLELSLRGIRVDEPGRAEEFIRVKTEALEVAKQINDAAGMKIVAKTAASPSALKKFLYEQLRLPTQYTKNAKKEKVVSTNVVTLRRLMDQFPGLAQLQEVGKLVLKHRRLGVVANSVKAERINNGRQFAQFRQDTVLGRLSSSVTPKGEGANLQNVDRRLRRFYLADTGTEND